MEIIERAVMPNGTEIQLEDWSSRNTPEYPDLYGLTIGVYPIAKNNGKGRWVESGERFRLTISHNNHSGYANDDVKSGFFGIKKMGRSAWRIWPHISGTEKRICIILA